MTTVNAYLGLNGKCEEVFNFYKECFGGELNLQLIRDTPMATQFPEAMQNQVLHGTLTSGSIILMGSDMVGPEGYQLGNNIALTLNCSSEEEINRFYNYLSQGGKIMDKLQVQFWGATFGALKDKYQINWMLHYDKNQQ